LWENNGKGYVISVVTAALNEAETIGIVISQIQSLGIIDEIIVVDDRSSDETADIAQKNGCKVIRNLSRLGQTRSLRRGIACAKGDFIVTIDSDTEHLPSDIPPLLEHMSKRKSDIVIGRRSSLPRLSEKIMSNMLRKFTGIIDTISGFKVISKRALEQEEFDDTETWGALFLLRCKRKGLTISEIPIVTPLRRQTTKMGGSFRSNIRVSQALVKCFLCILRII
jgi:glycosyltransferase involved in cell wall biosynthesis